MIIHRNNERFDHLKGLMFSWHQEFFFPLPEEFYYEMILSDRILAWSEDRDNSFFSLGNLFWSKSDRGVLKWKLRRAGLGSFYDKVGNNENQSIRQNTVHFDKCLKTYIALNEIANETDGYLFLDPHKIDGTIERYLGNRTNRREFDRQYNSLKVEQYSHSDKVRDWVLSLNMDEKLSTGKHYGSDVGLPDGKISKARLLYEELEIMPVLDYV